MASDGTYELIYFLAYRSGPEDFEYIVGPASLNEFASNATEFQERADASEELLAPGKLIDKYTSWANLDEAALGKYLMKLAARRQPRFHMYVISVIEELDDGNRECGRATVGERGVREVWIPEVAGALQTKKQ